jgi:hypothetical protein
MKAARKEGKDEETVLSKAHSLFEKNKRKEERREGRKEGKKDERREGGKEGKKKERRNI